MKILPKSNRTVFLLKPFYKPYLYTHTQIRISSTTETTRPAETHSNLPAAHPSANAQEAGRAPEAYRVEAGVQSLPQGTQGWLCTSCHPATRNPAEWGGHRNALWNRNQPTVCWWSERNVILPYYLPISHPITPSELMTFITTWILLISLVKADYEVMHIWLLLYLAKRWVWE